MKNLFKRQFETLLRVRAFADKHSDNFPPTSLSGKTFDTVVTAIPELGKYMRSHAAVVALAREGVTTKAEARQELRDRLDAIARTARSIGRTEPGVSALFRMPRKVSDQALIGAARTFLENAGAMKDLFVTYEMPAGFLEDLEAAILRLESALSEYADKKGIRSAASDAFETTMDRAMNAVYELAGMVPNKLKKQSTALQEWEIARRVASARPSKAAPPPQENGGQSGSAAPGATGPAGVAASTTSAAPATAPTPPNAAAAVPAARAR